MRGCRRYLLAILLLVLCPEFSGAQAPPKPKPPGVFALVIGCGAARDRPLKHAAPNALKVAKHFAEFNGAKVWTFTDEKQPVSRSAVLRCLWHEMPAAIPPGSLVLVYYAGHGQRVPLTVNSDGDHVPAIDPIKGSHLYLPLSGSSADDYFGNSITLDEIQHAIFRINGIYIGMFLDCCYSGGNHGSFANVESVTRVNKVRAFLLASSSANQESAEGKFTDALLNVWKSASTGDLTPLKLEEQVKQNLPDDLKPYMYVKLAYGHSIQANVANLNTNSRMLCFMPNRLPLTVYSLRIKVGTWEDDLVFEDGAYLPVLAPMKKVQITIQTERGPLFDKEIDLSGSRTPKRIDIDIPRELASADLSDEAAAKALEVYANVASDINVDPSELLISAALRRKAANPLADIRPLLTKLETSATAEPVNVLIAKAVQKDVPLPADDEFLIANRTVFELGGYRSAYEFYTNYASSRPPKERTTWLQKAMLSCALGKDQSGIDALTGNLSRWQLGSRDKGFLYNTGKNLKGAAMTLTFSDPIEEAAAIKKLKSLPLETFQKEHPGWDLGPIAELEGDDKNRKIN